MREEEVTGGIGRGSRQGEQEGACVQALWVLGSAATLQRSPVWAALLEDADRRSKIVPDAFARCAVRFAAVMIHNL